LELWIRSNKDTSAGPKASSIPPAHRGWPGRNTELINGEWRAASETYDVRNPYRGTLVVRGPRSSQTDLDDASIRLFAVFGNGATVV